MKPEGVPFWGVLAALVLAVAWWWRSYDSVKFDEPDAFQFHVPQVEKDSTRFGRRVRHLRVSDLEPRALVRFRTARVGRVITARVVALEGQRVRIEGTDVYVNGSKFDDDYCKHSSASEFYPELIVPEGCVFVLNDARWRGGADRFDSRNLGPIPVDSITHRFTPKEARTDRRRRR